MPKIGKLTILIALATWSVPGQAAAGKQAGSASPDRAAQTDREKDPDVPRNKNDHGDFVLYLRQPEERRVDAELVCADSISPAECLRAAFGAELQVKRVKRGSQWMSERVVCTCGDSSRSGCSGPNREGDTILHYHLAAKLGEGDRVRIRYNGRTYSDAIAYAKPDQKGGTAVTAQVPAPAAAAPGAPVQAPAAPAAPEAAPVIAAQPPPAAAAPSPAPAKPDLRAAPVPLPVKPAGARRGTTAAGAIARPVMTIPADKAVVGTKVPVAAKAPDAVLVQFLLDGKPLDEPVKGSGSYQYSWDTTAGVGTVANGAHALAAVAVDKAGNNSEPSNPVTVTVHNLRITGGPAAAADGPAAAIIKWETDLPSTSQVSYGTAANQLGSHNSDKTLSTSHSVRLSGLGAWTTYHYRVSSADDELPNGVTSEERTFDTPAVQITAPSGGTTVAGTVKVTASGIDKAGTRVQFKLDDAVPPQPQYNLNPAVEGSGGAYATSWDTTQVSNGPHSISAVAYDSSGKPSAASTVKLVVSNPPVMLSVGVPAPEATGAEVKWQTDKPSTSQVSYGTTTTYGSQMRTEERSSDHSLKLQGLTPATTYHYQVLSRDAEGNSATSPDATFVTRAAAPDEVQELREGMNTITGRFRTSKPPKVRVEVVEGNSVVEYQEAAVAGDSGTFTVALNSPLASDEQVVLSGVDSTGRPGASRPFDVKPSVMDWGRVRAYFTFGVMLSSNQTTSGTSGTTSNAFNSNGSSPYLAFDADNNWLRPARAGFWQRVGFHTFFGARLTQIGTAAAGTTQGATPASPAAPPTVTGFLANKQAGSVLGGLSVPLSLARWNHGGHPLSLYVAPLAKAGFYTTTDTAGAANVVNLTGTSFYKYYGFGTRVGLFREHRYWNGALRTDSAPEPLVQLDMLVGRWTNFEYVSPMTSISPLNQLTTGNCNIYEANPVNAQCFLRERLWRYALEGVVNMPHTPFIIGFSANLSAQRAKAPNTRVNTLGYPAPPPGYNFIAPPDDLRFLFGVRVDAKTLLSPFVKSPQ